MNIRRDGWEMDAILIAGPTASGKSSLAMEIAGRMGGTIVNTDSMQVYDTLRVLTARPSAADAEHVPHRLYGHVPASQSYSVGAWTRDVRSLLAETPAAPLVFVGGTGLYFRALLGGLSDMPDISDEIREKWRSRLAEERPEALHEELRMRDPGMAERLKPGDRQRLVRALEVFDATGRSIAHFQDRKGEALIDVGRTRRIVLAPDRAELRRRIRTRFEAMLEEGAIAEVESLMAMNMPATLPAMRAIGVREIAAYLAGKKTREEAIELSSIATGQYAKRQTTWFRNQFDDSWEWREGT